jgi:arylsulfatase A-like enzyme
MMIDDSRSNLLINLMVLTAIVFFAQIALTAANMIVYLGTDNVASSILLRDIFSAKIVWVALLQFLVSQLILYAGYISIIWYLSISIGEWFTWKWQQTYHFGIFLWLFSVVTIIAANNYFFPRSFFSKLVNEDLFHVVFTKAQLEVFLIPATVILLVVCLISVINLITSIYKKNNLVRHGFVLSFILIVVMALVMNHLSAPPREWKSATNQKPNIILIGLDAIRPDFVNGNSDNALHTPNINQFLQSATNFTDAYTPVAQTFPAWMSVLTGLEPKANSIRANLMDMSLIDTNSLLSTRLQKLGYETIYATDDLRFDTMIRRFGFDRVVGARPGVNNFILGTFNDYPLSNLLVTTFIGKWLFPYNYGNHEAIATYDPQNFLQLIQDSLSHAADKPLFFAVHFNTSGWPFGSSLSRLHDDDSWLTRYQEGVPIADKQLGEFLQILQQRHILDHAIVVLLSDHGVGLGLPGDRLTTEALYQGDKKNIQRLRHASYVKDFPGVKERGLDTSYGYGGDILSKKQYHVLLAFKRYGVLSEPVRIESRASLLDIMPTILDLLQQPALVSSRGISLKPLLLATNNAERTRPLFLETYNDSIAALADDTIRDSIQVGLGVFLFDAKTGMLTENPEVAKVQLAGKERAILKGNWLLAELPGLRQINVTQQQLAANKSSGRHQVKVALEFYDAPAFMVLLNLKTRQWTTELNTAWAKAAPLADLCQDLQHFYGAELSCQDCCQPFLRR